MSVSVPEIGTPGVLKIDAPRLPTGVPASGERTAGTPSVPILSTPGVPISGTETAPAEQVF